MPRYTLIVTVSGDGGGRVRSTPGGIDCPGACSFDFREDTTVSLSGLASGGSRFAGWQSTCTGTQPCEVVLDADRAVAGQFDDNSGGHNFVFVTQETFVPGSIGTLANADAMCMASAADGGLPGTFVAWLSTSTVDARTRLGTSRGWVRPDGQPVVDTIADLVAGKILFPPRITADGTLVQLNGVGHSVVVTGTNVTGTRAVNCSDWTNPAGTARVGNANNGGRTWTDWFDVSDCMFPQSMYCFGTGRMAPLTVVPSSGRLAFLTTGQWTSGGGQASADAFCQMEATNAGRSGTFKALIATSTASAASRFDVGGAPWVRPDGIPVAPPGTSPFDGVQVPINLTLGGSFNSGSWVASGADTLSQNAATNRNCNDWNQGTGGAYSVGVCEGVPEWFHASTTYAPNCSIPVNLYCFQQ